SRQQDNVRLGKYPLARAVYLYVPGNLLSANSQPAVEFVRLTLSEDGQDHALALGFIPVPPAIAQDGLRKLGIDRD
ncbi:MAG: hypothetical protein ACT4NU_07580, partial [Chromatiales bacterium]